MAKLCFILFSWASFCMAAASSPQWESTLDLLGQGKSQEAISALESWIQEAQTRGVRSSEAHHNLALAYSQKEDWGPAVYHLATSALLRANPVYSWQALHTLSLVQHRLMIQDALSGHWLFRVAFLIPPLYLMVLASVGFWVLLFSFFIKTGGKKPAMMVGGLLLLAAVSGWTVRAWIPPFAVVMGGPDGSALSSDATLATDKRLIDLPPGALVSLGAMEKGSVAVTAPFVGWLPSSSLRLLNRPSSYPEKGNFHFVPWL